MRVQWCVKDTGDCFTQLGRSFCLGADFYCMKDTGDCSTQLGRSYCLDAYFYCVTYILLTFVLFLSSSSSVLGSMRRSKSATRAFNCKFSCVSVCTYFTIYQRVRLKRTVNILLQRANEKVLKQLVFLCSRCRCKMWDTGIGLQEQKLECKQIPVISCWKHFMFKSSNSRNMFSYFDKLRGRGGHSGGKVTDE